MGHNARFRVLWDLGESLKGLLSSVSASLSRPVCKTSVELNVESKFVPTREVGIPCQLYGFSRPDCL